MESGGRISSAVRRRIGARFVGGTRWRLRKGCCFAVGATNERQPVKKPNNPLSTFILVAVVAAAVTLATLLAQDVPRPVLTITPTGTNQFLLAITNAVSWTNYEISRTVSLSSAAYPWEFHLPGTNGQSHFVVSMGMETVGRFRAQIR